MQDFIFLTISITCLSFYRTITNPNLILFFSWKHIKLFNECLCYSYSGEQLFDPLLILYICPLTKKL